MPHDGRPAEPADFAHAHEELTKTPWIPHLAAGLAAAGTLLALGSIAIGGRFYLQPLAEEGVVLPTLTQFVWKASNLLFGPLALIAALISLGVCFALWLKARRGAGGTGALFTIGALGILVTLIAVYSAALPVGDATRQSDPATESGR